MLISFTVGNFLSFKDKQTLSFVPEAVKEFKDYLHVPYLYDSDLRLLKSVALYGHNSHGKSNFLRAYSFFVDFIFSSFSISRKEENIKVEGFRLNTSSFLEPSFFECEFYLHDVKYKYGYTITTKEVEEEWLYYSQPKTRETYLYHRVHREFRINRNWNKESNNNIEKLLPLVKNDSLLMTVLIYQESIPRIKQIEKWFRGNLVLININHQSHYTRAIQILLNNNYRALITKFIEKADLGFITILEKIDSELNRKIKLNREFLELYYEDEIENFDIYTRHNIYDENHDVVDTVLFELLKNESSGTKKYLIICAYLAYAIKESQLVIIDELDSSFHSLLFKVLIEIYNDSKINNSGSQLIFTTHNTILLNKNLRRDQIVFIEKDEYGESSVRRLHTSEKPVRIDTAIEKEYIRGKLGGTSRNIHKQPELDLGFED